jgi:hypothetical protein
VYRLLSSWNFTASGVVAFVLGWLDCTIFLSSSASTPYSALLSEMSSLAMHVCQCQDDQVKCSDRILDARTGRLLGVRCGVGMHEYDGSDDRCDDGSS